MSTEENAINTVSKVNEFKQLNNEFSLLEFKKYLRTIKMKNVSGLTIGILNSSNICKKSSVGKKITWVDSNPINHIQLENAIRLSGLYIKNVNERYNKQKISIVDVAEEKAYVKTSFWGKLKNFFKI